MANNDRIQNRLNNNPFEPLHLILSELIKEDILNTQYSEGERIKEQQIADTFDVSRTTVRRAFETLIHECWLDYDHNRGVFIKKLSRKSFEDICEARLYFDSIACALASKHRSEEDLKEICMYMQPEGNTLGELLNRDTAFHKAIYNATHNDYIIRAYSAVGIEIARNKMFISRNKELFSIKDTVKSDHLNIFNAIKDQRTSDAYYLGMKHARIMRNDIENINTYDFE